MIDPQKTIELFYPEDTPLRRLLLRHSGQVRDKAVALAKAFNARQNGESGLCANLDLVDAGAMLHDIGIFRCHAPGILCIGSEPYLCHGIIGAELLRHLGKAQNADLEPLARVCERHTGVGLTAADIVAQGLPMPIMDYLPETIEEKIICLADKFYSKSGDGDEKPFPVVQASLAKFGDDVLRRFYALWAEVGDGAQL